jgi:hypothetical protein
MIFAISCVRFFPCTEARKPPCAIYPPCSVLIESKNRRVVLSSDFWFWDLTLGVFSRYW